MVVPDDAAVINALEAARAWLRSPGGSPSGEAEPLVSNQGGSSPGRRRSTARLSIEEFDELERQINDITPATEE